MEDDEDKTIFQTEEDKRTLQKEILGEDLTEDSEVDTSVGD